jgi:hypothetical protein
VVPDWARRAVIALVCLVVIWNTHFYRGPGGYDGSAHLAYASGLMHGHLPSQGQPEYWSPPGFYAVAGVLWSFAGWLHFRDVSDPVQLFNGALVVATALITFRLACLLFPRRTVLHLVALGFFALLPVVTRLAAMFHPEPLSLFLSTLALFLAARLIVHRRFELGPSLALGFVLGAGQLVRAFSLWTFAVVVITFALAAAAGYAPRRTMLRSLLVVILATTVLAGPWYVFQTTRYSNPVFAQPQPANPIWARRPVAFYVGLPLTALASTPFRPHFKNQLLPMVYADLWGDWFGYFAWGRGRPPGPPARIRLILQDLVGLVPTLLALAGFVTLLARVLGRRLFVVEPAQALAPLLIVSSILGFLYFTVSYPTADGDVIKPSYMLTAAPAWALAAGYAADRIWRFRRIRAALIAVLAVSIPIDAEFLFYRFPF